MVKIAYQSGRRCGRIRCRRIDTTIFELVWHCRKRRRKITSSDAINVVIKTGRVRLLSGRMIGILAEARSYAGDVATQRAPLLGAIVGDVVVGRTHGMCHFPSRDVEHWLGENVSHRMCTSTAKMRGDTFEANVGSTELKHSTISKNLFLNSILRIPAASAAL